MIIYDKDGRTKGDSFIDGGFRKYLQPYEHDSVGYFYMAAHINSNQTANITSIANIVYAMPFIPAYSNSTIKQIGYQITTGAGNSGLIGIYQNTSEAILYPSGLLWASDQRDSTAAVKTWRQNIPLYGGSLYWLAIAFDGNPTLRHCQVSTVGIGHSYPTLGFGDGLGTMSEVGYMAIRTYDGTLPNPYPAGARFITNSGIPGIYFSLDSI